MNALIFVWVDDGWAASIFAPMYKIFTTQPHGL